MLTASPFDESLVSAITAPQAAEQIVLDLRAAGVINLSGRPPPSAPVPVPARLQVMPNTAFLLSADFAGVVLGHDGDGRADQRQRCSWSILPRCLIAAKFVGDDHARHILAAFEQLAEELLGSRFVASALHQNIEHVAILIHGPP